VAWAKNPAKIEKCAKLLAMKATVWLAGLAVSILAVGAFSSTNAKNSYRLVAILQYKLEPDKADGTRVTPCQFCHINSTGAAPWNPFGLNLRDTFRKDTSMDSSTEDRLKEALYKVLVKKLDSDGDKYIDALEVYAGTLPGNKTSTPKRDLEDLEDAFVKAGGFAQFKAGEK
jgi:hypothetical protein